MLLPPHRLGNLTAVMIHTYYITYNIYLLIELSSDHLHFQDLGRFLSRTNEFSPFIMVINHTTDVKSVYRNYVL